MQTPSESKDELAALTDRLSAPIKAKITRFAQNTALYDAPENSSVYINFAFYLDRNLHIHTVSLH